MSQQSTPAATATTLPDPRPPIEVRGDLTLVCDEALEILRKDVDSGLYVRAGLLVRVARDNAKKLRGLSRDAGAPVIEHVPLAWLRDRLGRTAGWWERVRGRKKRVLVPPWVAENIAARAELPFPPLEGVIEAPTLRRDGSLLDQPGYDETSGLLYEPTVKFPPIPENILQTDVDAARTRILDLLVDFPFVAESDRVAAVAMILTAAVRSAIDGPCPLFTIRATTPGTGKSLLADVVSIISTGRHAARMVAGKDDDETRKLLLSIGIEGASVVLLDNVEGSFGSPAFAAALTSSTFADRLLGQSKRVTVSLLTVTWICTGNNLAFKGDLARRVVPIDLDAGVEHPEDRTGFRHEDLLRFVRDNRPQLVLDCLTVLRGYYELGELRLHGAPKMGSFEAWDDLIRGACRWVGLGDCIAGRERIREEGDNELEALRAALAVWVNHFGDTAVTVADAMELAAEKTDLRDALLALTGRKELTALALGHGLRKFKGRLAGTARFSTDGKLSAGRVRWRVEGMKSTDLFSGNGHAS